MQLWHGTADTTLFYPNFGEAIKEWTNVLGVSQTSASTDSPQPGWTHTRYGNTSGQAPLEAYSLSGVGHNLLAAGMAAQAIRYFGLDQNTTTTPPVTTTPPPVAGACRPGWPWARSTGSSGLRSPACDRQRRGSATGRVTSTQPRHS
jgi:acetylxylan esterase